jgi:quinol---cytochrome c reductase iron-sulfur subunit, bacillus type
VEPRRPSQPHSPPPSLWPIGFAVGIAILLLGLVVGWGIVLLGAVLAVGFGFLWVRDVVAGSETAPRAPGYDRGEAGVGAAPVVPGRPGEAALPLMDDEEIEAYPRSVFLEGATLGLGALIGGLITVPIAGFAVIPAFVGQKQDEVDVGPLDGYPEGEWRVATFMQNPEEGEVTRRTAFVRNNGQLNGVPSFTIISNRCAHLGCPVQPGGPIDEEHKQEVKTEQASVTLIPTTPAAFSCPCHGGAYDTEGNRRAGPPVRALDRYHFAIRDGNLILREPYSVGKVEGTGAEARIRRYELAGPGIHVDGPEAWLYPFESGDFTY